ncbi:MAG: DNA-3-methyladenine glycosylase 2 family protein [Thermoplasmata archaeon]|nr:DNA-3-methyladenine glycosylase 2 family protein [Thermoplasmata archaeon]
MDRTSFEIIPTSPYDFDLQWKFYSSSREPQPEIYKDGIWKRAFKIGNGLVPVKVTSIGTVEKPRLRVDAFSKLDAKEREYLANKMADIFRLREDLGALYDFMEQDEILYKIKKELYGLRPPGIGASIFEGAIRVIIQQQISLQVAYVMTGELVRRFGERIEIDDESYYDFPSPKVLASADENELRKCKLSYQKAKYIKELAMKVVDGYDLEKIRKMNNEEAIEELMKFNGIGRWTAELILITTLGRMDLCVPDDLGARKAVSYFYFDGKLQSGNAIRKFTERWGEFKGWIIYYLICAYNMEIGKNV